MNCIKCSGLAILLFCLIGISSHAYAADLAGSPMTLWRFLGVPQGAKKLHKLQDSLVNRRGKHPGLEKKPPLKKLTDPANLESEDKAIKAAAEIKVAEDQAPQKIKAIKYLGSLGCGDCYKGVEEALLAALVDCTEKVRYEAAKALLKTAGDPCKSCNASSCCSEKSLKILHERAYKQDGECCYKESSKRVRKVAAKAYQTCMGVLGPPEPEPEVEIPEGGKLPEGGESTEPAEPPEEVEDDLTDQDRSVDRHEPRRLNDRREPKRVSRSVPKKKSSGVASPIRLAGMSQAVELPAVRERASSRAPLPRSAPGFPRNCKHCRRPASASQQKSGG